MHSRGRGSGCAGRPVSMLGAAAVSVLTTMLLTTPAPAIEVNLTVDQAKQILASGREPMAKAKSAEEVRDIMQEASVQTRVGADPIKDPCGPSAILRTKRFWLEAFGRKEAIESKKQDREIRMPASKIQKLLDTPYLEIEVQLCGDDEYFAEGAEVVFQQNSQNIRPIDVGPPERGRKNEGEGPAYRSRFTARFSYDSFDPTASTKIVVFFPDGKLIEIPADFAKIR